MTTTEPLPGLTDLLLKGTDDYAGTTSMRIPKGVLRNIDALAKKVNRSRNQVLVALLRLGVAAHNASLK